MATAHPAPQRRAGSDRPAAHSRHRHDLRRAGRELSRRARRALRAAQLDPLHHLPPGGRGGQHGGGLRQAHRQARHLLRDPRARRHQCQHRIAYRLPGFDAHDPAGRPGGARNHRPRGLPGDRLPPHVRPDGQVGGPDRGCAAHSRAGQPGLPHRAERPAGAGRAGAARGHADRRGRGGRCRPLQDRARRAVGGRHGDAAPDARGGRAADGDPGRRRLERRGLRRHPGLRRGQRPAGVRLVPQPGPDRQPPSQLCRRSRRRRRPGAGQAHQGVRPHRRRRPTARRGDDRRLHAVRPAGAQAEAGACPCRRRGARPRLSGDACRSTAAWRTSPRPPRR